LLRYRTGSSSNFFAQSAQQKKYVLPLYSTRGDVAETMNSSPETGQVVRSPMFASPGGRGAGGAAAIVAVGATGGGAEGAEAQAQAARTENERAIVVVRMARGLAHRAPIVDAIS
jgi:hypothetical protein